MTHTPENVAGHPPPESWGLGSEEWQFGNGRTEQEEVAVGVGVGVGVVAAAAELEEEAVMVVTAPHWTRCVSGDQLGQASGQ